MNKKNLPDMQKNFFIIEGISVVKEYLQHKPQAVKYIVVKEKNSKKLEEVSKSVNIPLYISDSLSHEERLYSKAPIWAVVEINCLGEQNFFEIYKKKQRQKDTLIALDHITDPRNMGAIIRNAAFFGVDFIIAPKDRQVLLTQSCVSTSQGGLSLVEVVAVTNLARFIEKIKKESFWVIGASAEGESIKSFKTNFDKKVLVFGAEEKGLSQIIRKKCDIILAIDRGVKNFDSLNVSVATGIMVHALKNT